jgi:protein-tyrosine phosphatase
MDPPIPDSYWVRGGQILAGEYPRNLDEPSSRAKLRRILSSGVQSFLDLTEEEEYGIKPYLRLLWEEAAMSGVTVRYQRMPIPDMGTTTAEHMTRILDRLDGEVCAGYVVYIHCLGGIGRTGTVIGCYLARHGSSGSQALHEIGRLRRRVPDHRLPSPETADQRDMVLSWPSGG